MLQQDIELVRDTLRAERMWRRWVFARDELKRDQKVDEIDQALDALQRIERALEDCGVVPKQLELL